MRIEVEARVRRRSGFSLEVSFSSDGESLGVVGASGSGKSTLLEAMAGIEPARVVIDGRDVSRLPLHERRVGYVTQDALLFPHLTVRRNLSYGPRADGVEEVARSLGIHHLLDRMPRHLSGGERRRAALARAIASRPALLLLDEPFSGLDEESRRDAMSLLARVRGSYRLPMVLVSHLAEEVIGLADRAVRLDRGRITASGPSAAVLRAGEVRIDNYFTGRVLDGDRLSAGGVEICAALPEGAAGEVRLACYAHDIILATAMPEGLSARNCFWTEVVSVEPTAGAVLVKLGAPPLVATITSEARRALDIRPGARVVAVIKSTSIACLGRT